MLALKVIIIIGIFCFFMIPGIYVFQSVARHDKKMKRLSKIAVKNL